MLLYQRFGKGNSGIHKIILYREAEASEYREPTALCCVNTFIYDLTIRTRRPLSQSNTTLTEPLTFWLEVIILLHCELVISMFNL